MLDTRASNHKHIILQTAFFCLCLVPISAFDGKSVNYFFVVYPGLYLILNRAIKPSQNVVLLISLYSFIFIFTLAIQYEFIEYAFNRIISFLIFMTVFAYCFIRIEDNMVKNFKNALVIFSLVYSIKSIFDFFSYQKIGPLHFGAKDLIGTQRIGFIYILGFYICLIKIAKTKLSLYAKYVISGIIMIGLLLTFSRSSFVCLVISLLVYSVMGVKEKGIKKLIAVFVFIFIMFYLIGTYFPITVEFFNARLIETLLNKEEAIAEISTPEASFGTRIEIWKEIIEYVGYNPFNGSGYLGVWVISKNDFGSAHNQYMDVFLRTGVVGFMFYSILLYLIARYLYFCHKDLFCGFVGFLVYGFFHETIKESQGAFVLAFLLGMLAEHMRRRKLQNGKTYPKGKGV